jgi:hypothetical protein
LYDRKQEKNMTRTLLIALLATGCGVESGEFGNSNGFDIRAADIQELEAVENTRDANQAFEGRAGDIPMDAPHVFLPDEPAFIPERGAPEGEDEVEPEVFPIPTMTLDQTRMTYASIHRLAIDFEGNDGIAGMSGGNSCYYNPDSGGFGSDYNFQDSQDEPIEYDSGNRLLIVSPYTDRVAFLEPSGGQPYYEVSGLEAARVMGADFVTMETVDDNCTVTHRTHTDEAWATTLDGVSCDGAQLATDAERSLAFVANGDLWAIDLITGDARMIVEGAGDMVEYDPNTGAIVTATYGDTPVRAWNVHGTNIWNAYADGAVYQLHNLADMGAIIAHTDGEFVGFDGRTGEVWGTGVAWDNIQFFDISGDGTHLVASLSTGLIYTYEIVIEETE